MLGKLTKMEERIVLDAAAAPDAPANADGASDNPAISDSTASCDSSAGEDTGANPTSTSDSAADTTNEGQDLITGDIADAADGGATATAPVTPGDYTSLLLINDNLANYQQLVNSAADGVAVLVYDGESDSLQDILDNIRAAFAGETFESIALAAHGEQAGAFTLTSDVLVDAESLSSEAGQQEFFSALGDLLTTDGRLDVLSCFGAAGDAGLNLIAQLEQITGHDAAGSYDQTGSTTGADWILEHRGIDVASVYFNNTLQGFSSVLGNTPSGLVWTVTTADDVVDAGDGVISLREAIIGANEGNGDTITFASSLNGQEILLDIYGGTGNTIDITQSMTIVSNYDITIDGGMIWADSNGNQRFDAGEEQAETGSSIFHIFSVSDAEVSIQGLTFINAMLSGDTGGAVWVEYSTVTITDCTFANNYREGGDGGGKGAAIWFAGDEALDSLTVSDSDFLGNVADHGGAIYAQYAPVSIIGCTFQNNQALSGNGGAIFLKSASSATISDCTFSNNASQVNGGALYLSDSTATIQNSTFSNNWAGNGGTVFGISVTMPGNGGAISIESASSATISDCTFDINSATCGGAVSAAYSELTVQHSNFNANIAGAGGALSLAHTATSLDECNFTSNKADQPFNDFEAFNGGAILFTGCADLNVTDSNITNNVAIYSGGGLYFTGNNLALTNTTFNDNRAGENGGGLYLSSSGFTEASLDEVVFSSNSAEYGGGIFAENIDTLLRLDSVGLIGNDATSAGGGLYFTNVMAYLNQCAILNNTAEGEEATGGGIAVDGGSEITMLNTLLRGNSAYDGSALYLGGSAQVLGIYVTIFGNTVSSESGTAAAIGGYTCTNSAFLNSIIVGNKLMSINFDGETPIFTYTPADLYSDLYFSYINCWIGTDLNTFSSILENGQNGNIVGNSNTLLAGIIGQFGYVGGALVVAPLPTLTSPAASAATNVYLYDPDQNGFDYEENGPYDGFYYLTVDPDTGEQQYKELNGDAIYTPEEIALDSCFGAITVDLFGHSRTQFNGSLGAARYIAPIVNPVIETTVLDEVRLTPSHTPTGTPAQIAQAFSEIGQLTIVGQEGGTATLGDLANALVLALLAQDSGGGDAVMDATSGDSGENGGAADGSEGGGEGGMSEPIAVTLRQAPSTLSILNQSQGISAGLVVDAVLTTSMGTYSGMLVAYNSRAVLIPSSLVEAFGAANTQAIVLSALTLNAGTTLQACDALLARLTAMAADSEDAAALAGTSGSGSGQTGAGASGAVADMVRECQQALLTARGNALQANDMLQLIAKNISDFSDRIAENSFNTGLQKVAVANERLTVEYEVLNGLLLFIQTETREGRTLDAHTMAEQISGLKQDATHRARLILEGSDRASEDALAHLVKQMQEQAGENREGLRDRVAQTLGQWHTQIGLSAPIQMDAVSTGSLAEAITPRLAVQLASR